MTTIERPRSRAGVLSIPINASAAVWVMTAVLFAVSPLLAPGVMSAASLNSMLPFAAILVIASVGQTLVVQQGGIDLSIAGTISATAVVVTNYAALDGSRLPIALVLALVVAVAIGLVNGGLVALLGVNPIVATLGVNSLLLGLVQAVSGGAPTAAPDVLTRAALSHVLGIPTTVLIAVVFVVAVTVVIKKTAVGRQFEFVGANSRAARAAGLTVARTIATAYVGAALCYAVAGVLIAGFLRTPGLFVGDSYLLPSIASVVLGGTSLAGGMGSVIATAGGAVFLTQLNQVVLAQGATTAVQYLIQGGIIALGMGARGIAPWISRRARSRVMRSGSSPHEAEDLTSATDDPTNTVLEVRR
ncbi:ABC transporter permease [Saccharopolyspora phatthalungensis]|uniref:Ribose transport system permease protein n=1 Tax=Saccharopolyspora phatthalungensis TaxID=664693 RepID=A0A840QB64_9PSEU|nr:ABC transporter permease [Saccharopolyspora phatthalungensis]MBB5157187.1 ribose transport system permease protein [Saccharopolyspora phatthalungensis]